MVLMGAGPWLLLVGVLLAVMACGDDTAGGDIVQLTVLNASGEEVALSINGDESRIDSGDEDAITLSGVDEYSIVITGLDTGFTLFDETLTADEIEDRDNRIVVTSEPVPART